jgi:Hint module
VDNQNLCFPADAFVSMANGTRKAISAIKVGESVLDLHNQPTKVLAVDVHHGNFDICALHFDMPQNVDFAALLSSKNDVLLEATANHPVMVGGKKIPLSDVKAGDELLQLIDHRLTACKVNQVIKQYRKVRTVYNLHTAGKGFFVNGYSVLNK